MKKVLLFSIACVALLLTGCSGKGESNGSNGNTATPTPTPTPVPVQRLVCSQNVQSVIVNMIADFDNDELTYLGLKYEMDLSAYSDAQINAIKAQDMCGTVKASMQSYTNAFTNCKQGVENKSLLITADFDLDKLASGGLSEKTTLAEAKKELEKQGYKCSVTNK